MERKSARKQEKPVQVRMPVTVCFFVDEVEVPQLMSEISAMDEKPIEIHGHVRKIVLHPYP